MKTRIYAAPVVKGLKRLCRYALLNHHIYIEADTTHMRFAYNTFVQDGRHFAITWWGR